MAALKRKVSHGAFRIAEFFVFLSGLFVEFSGCGSQPERDPLLICSRASNAPPAVPGAANAAVTPRALMNPGYKKAQP